MTTLVPTLPAKNYFDPAIFDEERQAIFSREWIYVGHAHELENPNDYITVELAGYSLILVRDKEGQLKGYHNICRHRGAPLVTKSKGTLKSGVLSCQYHGWSYDAAGEFLSAPHVSQTQAQECLALRLYAVKVAEWNEFVFVNLDRNARPFEEDRAELLTTIENSSVDLNEYEYHGTMERIGKFNWKIWVDGFQECYHCATVHPCLSSDFSLRRYKIENQDRFSFHSCMRKGQKTPTGKDDGLWLYVYPTMGFPCYGVAYYTLAVIPLSATETKLQYRFFKHKSTRPGTMEKFLKFIENLTEEDFGICEQTQQTIQTGLYEHGYLNPVRENGVIYYQSLIREALESLHNPFETEAAASPVSLVEGVR